MDAEHLREMGNGASARPLKASLLAFPHVNLIGVADEARLQLSQASLGAAMKVRRLASSSAS